MMNFQDEILNRRVTGVYHNYKLKQLSIQLDNGSLIAFYDCAIIFDLGIVGHYITYISNSGTLGMAMELRKNNENPDDFNFLILSRDIKDYLNKNEIVISYKKVQKESL